MRNEQEMMDLILGIAQRDERIRAVMINGSRTNPNATRDIFQDYDIVYFVTQVEPYVRNFAWIDQFGERIVMQMPEDIQDPPPSNDGTFVYLMQFADGNRIDLTIYPIAQLDRLEKDSLSRLLLDKDGLFPPLDPPSEQSYLPTPPSAKQFADCCNEFWWVSPYVAKGLWREEITYAKQTMDEFIREQLFKMLTWSVGVQIGFTVSVGKSGKYLRKYLPPQRWELLLKTYADADYAHTWDALEAMCELFHQLAVEVAARSGFEYLQAEEDRVCAHLRHIRALPRDAKEMY